MKSRGRTVLLCLLVTLVPAGRAICADDPHLYVTWEGAEPDKGASAWYIKRHIDPAAVFQVRPQGFLFDVGTPFDTPQARYRRTQNASTLESLLRDYPSSDPAIRKLGQLMHDIEINIWQPKRFAESAAVESRVKEIAELHGDRGVPIGCLIGLFDNVYAWLEMLPHDPASLATPAVCKVDNAGTGTG
jgi:hypothetical protein